MDSKGMVLLAIATMTEIASKPACPVEAKLQTLTAVQCSRPVSQCTFIDNLMQDIGAAPTSKLSTRMNSKADYAASWLAQPRLPKWMMN